jgi:hypothetical protein
MDGMQVEDVYAARDLLNQRATEGVVHTAVSGGTDTRGTVSAEMHAVQGHVIRPRPLAQDLNRLRVLDPVDTQVPMMEYGTAGTEPPYGADYGMADTEPPYGADYMGYGPGRTECLVSVYASELCTRPTIDPHTLPLEHVFGFPFGNKPNLGATPRAGPNLSSVYSTQAQRADTSRGLILSALRSNARMSAAVTPGNFEGALSEGLNPEERFQREGRGMRTEAFRRMVLERAEALLEDIPEDELDAAVSDDDGDSVDGTSDEDGSDNSSEGAAKAEDSTDEAQPVEAAEDNLARRMSIMSVQELTEAANTTMGSNEGEQLLGESEEDTSEWGRTDTTYQSGSEPSTEEIASDAD